MTSIRLTGTITAKSPIFITRPEQGDVPLTMNVIRGQGLEKTHAIPGETIKGMLRQFAYLVCVDAASRSGDITVNLKSFYKQTAGGINFGSDRLAIGEDSSVRIPQPLLSLFGSATPKLTGRITVHHAIAQPAVGLDGQIGTGLPPGMRRDALSTTPQLANIINDQDRELWARQNSITTRLSEANDEVKDAIKLLGRAKSKSLDEKTIGELEVALKAAQENAAKIKDDPEFQQTVQRPIPVKPSSPAGTVYDHQIQITNGTPEEIGLLMAALQMWNLNPRVGGGATTGYGQILANYGIERLTTEGLQRQAYWKPAGSLIIGEGKDFVSSEDPEIKSAILAWSALEENLLERTEIFGV